jgi:hypothetical protein
MTMTNNQQHGPFKRLLAGVVLVGSATALLAGVLAVPAGAAGRPFATQVTIGIGATVQSVQTGQPVTFAATVSSVPHHVPDGEVTFSVTGADGSTVDCDTGDLQTVSVNGIAKCGIADGLSAASGPFTVVAQYTDNLDSTYQPSTGTRTQVINLGATATTVTPQVTPAVTGEPLAFTAAVAPAGTATGSPTGTVTFGGVTCDGGSNVQPLSGGTAQCTVAGGLLGRKVAYPVTATYSGDTNFAASTGTGSQVVAPAATALTLTPSTGSCSGDVCTIGAGSAISFVATAAATGTDSGSGTPGGTFTFAILKPGSKTSYPCDGGTNVIPLVGGTATCTISDGLPAVVYYKVSATLASPGYQPGVASLFENASLGSSTVKTSVPKDLGAGQTFDVTAIVTPIAGYTGSSLPTGYVNITICGANSNGSNGCQGGAEPVGPGGVATLVVGGGESPGSYQYQAIYTGDTNFYSSIARAKSVSIDKSDTVLSLSEPGGFVSINGDAVAITATVAVPDGGDGSSLVGPPTGNVTFTITDPNGNPVTCEEGNVQALPTSNYETQGSVTCLLPPGTLTDLTPPQTDYKVVVDYQGDSDYVASEAKADQIVVPPAD